MHSEYNIFRKSKIKNLNTQEISRKALTQTPVRGVGVTNANPESESPVFTGLLEFFSSIRRVNERIFDALASPPHIFWANVNR